MINLATNNAINPTTVPTINSPKIGTEIQDTNGAEIIKLTATASAANEFTVINAAASGKPEIAASGTDTNISMRLAAKGSGSVEVTKGAVSATTQTSNGTASALTGLVICNKGSALAVTLNDGTIVGETKLFTNKGAGDATITPNNLASGTSVTIQQHEAAHFIWDGTNWFLIASYNGTLNA